MKFRVVSRIVFSDVVAFRLVQWLIKFPLRFSVSLREVLRNDDGRRDVGNGKICRDTFFSEKINHK